MQDNAMPVPPAKTLLKATVAAAALAVVTLTTIILPAEYNIDPTGIGGALGLTQLNTEEVAAARPEERQAQDQGQALAYRTDRVTIEVPAGKGLEYKLHLAKHGHMQYEWSTENGPLYFDFHGEPTGDTTGYFESFAIATAAEMRGSLTTPFDGSHGWYWKNNGPETVTVTLSTKGFYDVIGLKQ
ncbi:hypothetical protein [Microbulbifer sp. SAOS-129_SWC]|uniref:hypothetical protein n=1 Tax=Microbulbifer sp. SAOS-129_SWC TaxID=3145235 RepID=UPI003217F645